MCGVVEYAFVVVVYPCFRYIYDIVFDCVADYGVVVVTDIT